jgi:hypothetical protein
MRSGHDVLCGHPAQRFDHAEQPVGGDADRSGLLRARRPGDPHATRRCGRRSQLPTNASGSPSQASYAAQNCRSTSARESPSQRPWSISRSPSLTIGSRPCGSATSSAVSRVRLIGLMYTAPTFSLARRSPRLRAGARPVSDSSTSVEPANRSSADRVVASWRMRKTRVAGGRSLSQALRVQKCCRGRHCHAGLVARAHELESAVEAADAHGRAACDVLDANLFVDILGQPVEDSSERRIVSGWRPCPSRSPTRRNVSSIFVRARSTPLRRF